MMRNTLEYNPGLALEATSPAEAGDSKLFEPKKSSPGAAAVGRASKCCGSKPVPFEMLRVAKMGVAGRNLKNDPCLQGLLRCCGSGGGNGGRKAEGWFFELFFDILGSDR